MSYVVFCLMLICVRSRAGCWNTSGSSWGEKLPIY